MKTIGRIDRADFPELALSDIDIKVDTGAYTSSIHSHHIREELYEGEMWLKFQILDPTHPEFNDFDFKTKNYKKKKVKNSFGGSEERFVIKTKIVLFDKTYPIALSLSQRSDMRFPILIGRKLLNRRFVVDTSKKMLSSTLKQEKINKPQD